MGRQLVWEQVMIKQELRTQNQTALRPKEKGLLIQGCELPAPLASQELAFLPSLPPSPQEISDVIYIFLLRSSSSYICQSSMLILEYTSHRLLFLALCELLWPPSHCPEVTSTSMGSGCQLWVFNMEVIASPGVAFLPCSYGWPIGLRISFRIFRGIASGDVAPSSPVILACRGQGRPRKYILAVWIPFVRPQASLPPWRGLWA